MLRQHARSDLDEQRKCGLPGHAAVTTAFHGLRNLQPRHDSAGLLVRYGRHSQLYSDDTVERRPVPGVARPAAAGVAPAPGAMARRAMELASMSWKPCGWAALRGAREAGACGAGVPAGQPPNQAAAFHLYSVSVFTSHLYAQCTVFQALPAKWHRVLLCRAAAACCQAAGHGQLTGLAQALWVTGMCSTGWVVS